MLRKLIILSVLIAALLSVPVLNPPQAQAAAINLGASHETRVRLAVNRYAEIQVAQREPYCYGGTGPNCFDCSGLVVAAYRWASRPLPVRTSTQLRNWTTPTSLRYARTGDLIFYPGHVEIFYKKNGVGSAMAVSATHTGGPPVNFHRIRPGYLKIGKAVR